MLTSDLLKTRQKDGRIEPRWLKGAPRKRAQGYAETLVAIFDNNVGQRRSDLDEELALLEVAPRDRIIVAGLRKLIDDRCTWEAKTATDPVALRLDLFRQAAAAYRELAPRAIFDRNAVLDAVGQAHGLSPTEIEDAMYADLKQNEVLIALDPIDAKGLLEAYDVGLAQALLLRARRVQLTLPSVGDNTAELRRFFRRLRFHGLLHAVQKTDEGFSVYIDGPMSLFEASVRYGLRLALMLRDVLALSAWRLDADVQQGRGQAGGPPLRFQLGPEQGLVAPRGTSVSSTGLDIDAFASAFQKLRCDWAVQPCEQLFALPGEIVCIPDLVFVHEPTKERVFFEAFGFWSRTSVWQRVELLRRGFPEKMILAVGKNLRVSEDVLDEGDLAELVTYRTALSANKVLERLEHLRTI